MYQCPPTVRRRGIQSSKDPLSARAHNAPSPLLSSEKILRRKYWWCKGFGCVNIKGAGVREYRKHVQVYGYDKPKEGYSQSLRKGWNHERRSYGFPNKAMAWVRRRELFSSFTEEGKEESDDEEGKHTWVGWKHKAWISSPHFSY